MVKSSLTNQTGNMNQLWRKYYNQRQDRSYNPKLLIILSNEVIPDDVVYYLSLGHKFRMISVKIGPVDQQN